MRLRNLKLALRMALAEEKRSCYSVDAITERSGFGLPPSKPRDEDRP
ncbi:hypothetical protein SJ05684_c23670 [Sinorhizobium sojae CCBAU 05684]|uniref:Uncharacterized protein n=1 Tax=Sinorhizobium sojae CCBAU 05684 TaxID=716928 RepID=A0A249PDN0_9HYPH|nr:hypothetical protein SJ05684_c23670 [Sinorhizobium sojae CCBAU 05684]